jgi:hypothetical protein
VPENLAGTLTLSTNKSMYNAIPLIIFCELHPVATPEYPKLPPTKRLRSRRRLPFDLQNASLYIVTDFLHWSCTTKLALSQKLVEGS